VYLPSLINVVADFLVGDVSTGVFHLVVQGKFRKDFFHLHNILHPGGLASRRLVSSRYVWCSLSKDVAAWAKACLHCQQSKIHRHAMTQPLNIPVAQLRSLTFTSIWRACCNIVTIVIIF
jgi:hypothetical protein